MRMGLPYDSDAGRSVAADITAYLTSTAAVVSTELAEALGPFPAYSEGTVKEDLRTVWVAHCNALGQPPHATRLRQLVAVVWEIALKQLDDYGARNAYLTLLAPTGTISFLMGADTTGCEPEFALRKTKKLVGGSSMPLPNEAMRPALEQLGYSAPEIETVLIHLKNTGDIAGTAIIRDEHLSVFDCATAPEGSKHNISSKGHLWMLAAIQPHLSMGISKTVNLPEDITVDEMADIGFQAWKLKLKGVTLYRSGCKRSEPLNVDGAKKQKSPDWPYGYRRKMPHSRRAVIQDVKFADKVKFQWMFGHRGDDRDPNKDNEQLGEIFVKVNKEGSTLQGALDGACMMASLAIQHGASVAQIIKLLSNTRWPPNGRTNDPNVKTVSSPLDYLARYLRVHYDDDGFYRGPPLKNVVDIVPVTNDDDTVEGLPLDPADELRGLSAQELYDAGLEPDGEVCWSCGNATYRQGSCQVCPSCGSTTGCGG